MRQSRILCLTPYPTSAPSNRTRVEQYIPLLRERGVSFTIRAFLDETAYRRHGIRRVPGSLAGLGRRLVDIVSASRYDAVLVHREALPLPTALAERVLSKVGRRLVFDFDDAIYLPQPYSRAPAASLLRSPRKFGAMVGAAHLVIAGNRHLARHAGRYSRNVVVIPTAVDTDRITPRAEPAPGPEVVIGWIGSRATAHYLTEIAPALNRVLDRYGHVALETVGAPPPPGLRRDRVSVRPWALHREADDLRSFDIGIMPSPDDEWARGKCGYKALQYMSAGVPAVSSPVGVATEIVEHGRNGLLAISTEDWDRALSSLVENPSLRQALGAAGRETVLERYSVHVWAPRLLAALVGDSA